MRIEQIIKIRKELFKINKPNEFVIPSPNSNEDEQSYISRCISDIGSEYDQEGQAYAVCKGKWDE